LINLSKLDLWYYWIAKIPNKFTEDVHNIVLMEPDPELLKMHA